MLLFGQKEDETLKKYKGEFEKFLDSLNDENLINRILADFTILNIELDKNDGAIRNAVELLKKNKVVDKKTYIKFQYEDMLKTSKPYTEQQHNRIVNVMQKILPQEEQKGLLAWIIEGFNNATGKKK